MVVMNDCDLNWTISNKLFLRFLVIALKNGNTQKKGQFSREPFLNEGWCPTWSDLWNCVATQNYYDIFLLIVCDIVSQCISGDREDREGTEYVQHPLSHYHTHNTSHPTNINCIQWYCSSQPSSFHWLSRQGSHLTNNISHLSNWSQSLSEFWIMLSLFYQAQVRS